MSVHQYKNGTWYVKYKNQTTRGFKTKKEAKIFEAKLLCYEVQNITYISFYKLIKEYLNTYKDTVTYGTYQKATNAVKKYIKPHTEDKDIQEIKNIDCLNFYNYLRDLNKSTETKNWILGFYKQIFEFACLYYDLKANPSEHLKRFHKTTEEILKQRDKDKKTWSIEEFIKFYSVADISPYKELFACLYLTGARMGEIQALTWNDLKNGQLSITKSLTAKTKQKAYEIKEPKNISSIRDITVSHDLEKILNALYESEKQKLGFNDDWFIFGGRTPTNHTTALRYFNKWINDSQVKKITIHSLRHSHATNLINDGVPITSVSARLGHSTPQTTLRTYTHSNKVADDKLNDILNNSSHFMIN